MKASIVFVEGEKRSLIDMINYESVDECSRIVEKISFVRLSDNFYKALQMKELLDFDTGRKYFIIILENIPEEEFENDEIGHLLNYAPDLMLDQSLDHLTPEQIPLNRGPVVDQIFK